MRKSLLQNASIVVGFAALLMLIREALATGVTQVLFGIGDRTLWPQFADLPMGMPQIAPTWAQFAIAVTVALAIIALSMLLPPRLWTPGAVVGLVLAFFSAFWVGELSTDPNAARPVVAINGAEYVIVGQAVGEKFLYAQRINPHTNTVTAYYSFLYSDLPRTPLGLRRIYVHPVIAGTR